MSSTGYQSYLDNYQPKLEYGGCVTIPAIHYNYRTCSPATLQSVPQDIGAGATPSYPLHHMHDTSIATYESKRNLHNPVTVHVLQPSHRSYRDPTKIVLLLHDHLLI
jgi:hypothetical protein